jgi:hypothetical protein
VQHLVARVQKQDAEALVIVRAAQCSADFLGVARCADDSRAEVKSLLCCKYDDGMRWLPLTSIAA